MKRVTPQVRAAAGNWTGRTLFGRWTVERLIGVGGTSAVLQARHRNGRQAALKILHPHLAVHSHTRERFLREGRLANLVKHPGVVAVLDDFTTDDGTAVLVLELVEGQTLAALAKEAGGVLDAREVVAAASAVLEILAVAHDVNVIHRDIKPENILRCTNGSYKLADFGLATLCHELGMLTGTNAALGTPAYMSPEQARGETRLIDARTDVWALGATMFTLLTGSFLHAGARQKNLVFAAATEPVPPVLSLQPTLYPPLAEVIDRAVRMSKSERWPNVRAMLAALRTIDLPPSREVGQPAEASTYDEPGASTALSSLLSWTRAGTSKSRGWFRAPSRRTAGLVGVAAIAVAGLQFWSDSREATSVNGTASRTPPRDVARTDHVAVPRSGPDTVAAPTLVSVSPRENAAVEQAQSPKRAVKAMPRVSAKAAASPLKNSTAHISNAPTRRMLTVPDEILDRRE